MRLRFGILLLVLVAALTGCGGEDDQPSAAASTPGPTGLSTPSSPLTELTVPCAEFSGAAKKIADAQRDIYTRSGGADAVDHLATKLASLKDGAPDAVRNAVDDLVDAFRTAATLMEKPTAAAQAQLAGLATKLSEAGKTVSDYVVAKCTS